MGSNSVYAVIKSPSQCLAPDSAKSNLLNIKNITSVSNLIPVDFHLYPNPVDNKLFIEGLEPDDIYIIFDAVGKVILSSQSKTDRMILDLSAYANGEYNVHFIRGTRKWTVSIIKN